MSETDRKNAKMTLAMSTTIVVATTSSPRRKGHLLHLRLGLGEKGLELLQSSRTSSHLFSDCRVRAQSRSRVFVRGRLCDSSSDWQARRDSNPQPSVLETDALPVRATGL